jgi:hydrogenase maturation protein HypF
VAATGRARSRIVVEGIVQGVGFRPFVHALATRLGLAGFVGNDAAGVFVEVEGDPAAVAGFAAALEREAPPLAVIDRVGVTAAEPTGAAAFVIAPSVAGGERSTLVSPDTATCADCLRELLDPADRRYRYPFVNCTNCGPRFTIITSTPYDRPATTMAGFELCAACAAEYHDPADRRFHAQPVCCAACGPALRLLDADGKEATGAGPGDGDPLAATIAALRGGRVVAIKGLGGYHLAADATDPAAVAALRGGKHREDKPFALMVAGLAEARRLCHVDGLEASMLTGPHRPIVLLRRRGDPDPPVAQAVAPGNRFLGLMLPYTPLHHLLAAGLGRPFVLTSGNVSDEPIAYQDDDALARLGGIADLLLTHDRAIHTRTDDSVTRAVAGRELPIRRSRGYVPRPVPVAGAFPRPVLACGAELKNTFALAKGSRVFVSHHIGDLENYETLRSFTTGIAHFERLFDAAPAVLACDTHPEYLSTKYALDRAAASGAELVRVQHHHAHIASCLADNGEAGPVIGVAFDGTGYGEDGTIWGGEFLVADLASSERAGSLAPVALPGGAAAIREPWRMAAAYLDAIGEAASPTAVAGRNARRWDEVLAVARAGLNSPLTSSAGRLFDAAAAVLGVRDAVNYEGQAAIELEQLADRRERGAYPARLVDDGGLFRVAGTDLVAAVAGETAAGTDPALVAARFHNGVAACVVAACERVRAAGGPGTVALSGGVFQNLLLVERVLAGLEEAGFRVLTHSRVPPNDGGISLGQAAVAGARDRSGAR